MIVVENGTGLANADAYITLAFYVAYHAARGYPDLDTDDEAAEAAIRRGTMFIDGRYRTRFPGARLNGRGQSREWPRRYVLDGGGNSVPSNAVPVEIMHATAEAARLEQAAPNVLTDPWSDAGVKQVVVGPISKTYTDSAARDRVAGQLTRIEQILEPLLLSVRRGAFVQRA